MRKVDVVVEGLLGNPGQPSELAEGDDAVRVEPDFPQHVLQLQDRVEGVREGGYVRSFGPSGECCTCHPNGIAGRFSPVNFLPVPPNGGGAR